MLELLRERLNALARHRRAVGLQYAVYRGGQPCLQICHGYADVAEARLVSPETCFNIYSITKPFTALAILILASRGRLLLDQPIGEAAGLEGLESYGTIRQTLVHRAGFRNPNPLRWIHEADTAAPFDDSEFLGRQIRALQGTRRRWAASGYSNLGYLLLGVVVSRATGLAFDKAVEELILHPLRCASTQRLGFAFDPECHARGHVWRHSLLARALPLLIDHRWAVEAAAGSWLGIRRHAVDGAAYGGLFANAAGLGRFGQALLGLAPGLPAEVCRSALTTIGGGRPERSLALIQGTCLGHEWFGHAGGGLGGYGELRIYPHLSMTSVLLTNGPGLRDARCLDQIDELWMNALG